MAVKVVVLLLMGLTAVGYTTVFHYCMMSHSTECCCSDQHQNNGAKSSTGTSLNNERESCNVKIVAGGLTPVALNAFSDTHVKVSLPEIGIFSFAVFDFSVPTSISFFAHADDIAPPKVDIYVRSGAFLI